MSTETSRYICMTCNLVFEEPTNIPPAEKNRCPRCNAFSAGWAVQSKEGEVHQIDNRVVKRGKSEIVLPGSKNPIHIPMDLVERFRTATRTK